MEPEVLAGMIFTIVVLAMVGGFVLLIPLARRLGAILELRLQEKSVQGPAAAQLHELQSAIQGLQAQLEELAERQEFTEALLHEKKSLRLPPEQRSG